MNKNIDYFAQYRNISNKLKKRLLKKPNLPEGSEQFATLAKQFENEEAPQYAALCCLAQARCEHSLSNAPGEIQALVNAAENFLTAEIDIVKLACPSFEENLTAAINCFNHAIRVNVENSQPTVAASLSIRLASVLRKLNRPDDAAMYYQRAAEFQAQNPLDYLTSMSNVARCKIETRDYEGTLTILTEMSYLIQEITGGGGSGSSAGGAPVPPILGVYTDILAECEISRVLLLMLLQPTPERIRPEHAKMLEAYTWEATSSPTLPVNYLNEDTFLLLQSFVMACQCQDLESLNCLQQELWPLLTTEQKELVHLVIQEITNPSGTGI